MVLSGELLYERVDEKVAEIKKFSPKLAKACTVLLEKAGDSFDEETSLQMKSQFEKADADSSGKLSQEEFRPIALEMTVSLQKAVGEWRGPLPPSPSVPSPGMPPPPDPRACSALHHVVGQDVEGRVWGGGGHGDAPASCARSWDSPLRR